jgi:hypothetical protein
VTFQGTKIKIRGANVGIAMVEMNVMLNEAEADRMIDYFRQRAFGGMPVVLTAVDPQGTPTYYGRADLVRVLLNIDVRNIAWMEYTID